LLPGLIVVLLFTIVGHAMGVGSFGLMSNAYPAEVNRTVQYRTAAGKLRPAVITALAGTLAVTAASRTSNVVTLTVNNSLAAGRWVHVDLVDATYDGLFRLSSANATTVTYTQVAANAGTTTGTIRDVDTATLRVGRHGETYASKLRWLGSGSKNDTWRP